VFVASASARGLNISLLGNNITVGSSGALIDSTPKAQAQGAGVLLVGGTIANALVTGPNQTQQPPEACVLNLPLAGLLSLATACGEAAATTANGLPQAVAAGSVASIDIGLSLLDPLINQLTLLLDQTIASVVDPLLGLLGGLLNPLLGALNLDINTSLVSDLLDGLRRATSVLTISLGPSTSSATSSAQKVTGEGIADGAIVDVLPGLSPLGAPLLRILVGAARATVDITRPAANQNSAATAVATPSFQASVATVQLGLPILGNISEIPISLGQPLTLLAGTPLESTISAGAGSTSDGPNGTKVAVADGVSLQLLKGLSGGIGLELAHAEASGGGASAVFTVQQRLTPVPADVPQAQQPILPKTGGQEPWLPLMGAILMLAALVTRRAVARR
jgi:LPXTG-motif cell wall-anchored protein